MKNVRKAVLMGVIAAAVMTAGATRVADRSLLFTARLDRGSIAVPIPACSSASVHMS